jgi:hypothetical protein
VRQEAVSQQKAALLGVGLERQALEIQQAGQTAALQFFQAASGFAQCSIVSGFSPPWDAAGQAADKACSGWMRA